MDTPPAPDNAVEDLDTLTWDATDPGAGLGRGGAYLVCALQCARPLAGALAVDLEPLRRIEIGRACSDVAGPANVTRLRGGRSARIDVPDGLMSRDHAVLERSGGGWTLEDLGSKNGSAINGVRSWRIRVVDGDVLEIGGTSFVYRTGRSAVPRRDVSAVTSGTAQLGLATVSVDLVRVFARLRTVAGHDVPVLITGETGTGKELVARAVHAMSGRRGELVAVNCGALPPALIETELFGCAPGAYSGAGAGREGLIRQAAGGTVLLDEVAELSLPSQAALLRVLQAGEVRPVGADAAMRVDVRFVAATHQDLSAAVDSGRFRTDLYSRLAGFQLAVPPLRSRREDLGILVASMLAHPEAAAASPELSRAAMRALMLHSYPLNIRELEHALAAALVLADGGRIDAAHLPAAMRTPAPEVRTSEADRALRARIVSLLAAHAGNVSAVARAMGKAPVQIRRWCRRLDVDIERFR